MRSLEAPDEAHAGARAWEVVAAAYEQLEPTPAPRRRITPRALALVTAARWLRAPAMRRPRAAGRCCFSPGGRAAWRPSGAAVAGAARGSQPPVLVTVPLPGAFGAAAACASAASRMRMSGIALAA